MMSHFLQNDLSGRGGYFSSELSLSDVFGGESFLFISYFSTSRVLELINSSRGVEHELQLLQNYNISSVSFELRFDIILWLSNLS